MMQLPIELETLSTYVAKVNLPNVVILFSYSIPVAYYEIAADQWYTSETKSNPRTMKHIKEYAPDAIALPQFKFRKQAADLIREGLLDAGA